MRAGNSRSEPMASADAAWLHMESPTNLMVVTGLMLFDEPLEFERLKTTLKERLLRFERFRQRVVEPALSLGGPRWETDPNFDIRAHVHRLALPAPGDQAALQDLVSDIMSAPLDFSKPPWHYYLIEGYGSGCAVLARLHHCIADGIALTQVLLGMTDPCPEPPAPAEPHTEPHTWNPLAQLFRPLTTAVDTTLHVADSLLQEAAELLNHPEHALDLARLGAGGVAALGKLLLIGPDAQTLFKGRLGVSKRVAWSAPIPLQDVKAVGRITGTTVNDVLLTAVTGALRCYLQRRGQPTDGITIRALVPVNLRPLDASIELGNRFGLVFVDLPIGVADPFERLLGFKQHMAAIKDSPEAVVAFGILNTIGMIPAGAEQRVVELFGNKATAVMTNVPGPREPLYLAGKRLRRIMCWVPKSGRLGLGVSILSYAGEVCIGVATDAGLVPDPEAIVVGFQAEFDELMDLVRLAEGDNLAEGAAPPARTGDPALVEVEVGALETLYDTLC
jgi:diacylglycerol O-acyltransferase / wax synthase